MSRDPALQREALSLFDAFVDLAPEERARRLASLGVDRAALAAEVARLLARDADLESVLDGGVAAVAPTLLTELGKASPPPSGRREGGVVGGFRLLRVIGRGGMGEVWLAERSVAEFDQKVALKLLPRGMDTAELVQRFLRERRILAGLEHPGIARFIDGGLSDDGLPWYAMEYVEGKLLTDYARKHELDLHGRVALMAEICDAVAFAQARLVVHRDLKPSNILVDSEGRPRLLDFGIAKLLQDDGDASATRTGVQAMSPAYAAPEQILDEPIGTATDVYALGVVLYELVTGQLPHRRSGNLQTLSQQVSGENALRPSEVLRLGVDTTGLGLDATAMTRLRRGIDADLDSVVLNALRREPDRRYANAAAFAEDLRAWLDRRPVRARPDTMNYRVRRFVRRHAVGVAATAAVMLALLLGLGVALHQASEAQRQAERADLEAARAEAEADTAIAQAALVREQAARAKRALEFLTSLFRDEDPMMVAARGRMSMDEAFEDALSRIDQGFDDDAALKADLLDDFAEILVAKGRVDEAELRFRLALEQAILAHGEDHPAVAESLENLGVVAIMRGDAGAGRAHIQRALAIRERHAVADPAAYANTANNMAVAHYHDGGDVEGAARWMQVAHDGFLQTLGEDSPRTESARINLGSVLMTLGRYDEAEPLLRAVLASMERRGGGESGAMLPLLSSLGTVARARGDDAAEWRYADKRLTLARSLFPQDHVWHAQALVAVAVLSDDRGEDGSPLFEEAVAMYARLGVPEEAEARGRWAVALMERGDHQAALEAVGPIDHLCEAEPARVGTDCFVARVSHARVLVAAGQAARALEIADALPVQFPTMFQSVNRYHADTLESRAGALAALGQTDEARAEFERARAMLAGIYGDEHASTRRIVHQLAQIQDASLPPP